MYYFYNPLSPACKSSVGAIANGEAITITVYKNNDSGENSFSAKVCNLIINQDGCNEVCFPMKATDQGWTITLKFNCIGLYYYYFALDNKKFIKGALHQGVLRDEVYSKWQLTVCDAAFSTPNWFKGGIMYQIFPDRFYRAEKELPCHGVLRTWGETPYFRPNEDGKVLNNDFFGGNIEGIREKLDYLHALGVTVIYLNPIFEAYSNHRYDTGDYKKIASLLGTEEDFKNLVSDAAKKGIHIILDGVFNHTGDDSVYFNRYETYNSLGAYQSKESPYFDWYCFTEYPNQYDSWWGITTLPAVNERSESYQNFMFSDDGVIKYWLKRGIGGYRLDVADELPDFFLRNLRRAVKNENPDAIIIGEVWEDASNKIAYGNRREYFLGSELDSVMNYPLKDAIIQFLLTHDTHPLRETIAMLIDHYPKETLDCLMNHLGTHDTARILTVLGQKTCFSKEEMAVTSLTEQEKDAAKQLLKFGIVLQYTLPGIPSIYYGDEIGMEGYSDPFCRNCFDWNHQDKELMSFYQKLSYIRTEVLKNAFKDGVYREIFATNTCLVFERRSENQTAYVYVNHGNEEFNIRLNGIMREHISEIDYENVLPIRKHTYGIVSRVK